MEDRNTIMFNAAKTQQKSTREVLEAVYAALEERGYNGIDQMVGYILSGDPSYITSHNNARLMISRIDRDDLLEEIRFLLNGSRYDSGSPLTLILSGQSEIWNILKTERCKAITQRIMYVCKTGNLTQEQVGPYIASHLRWAGSSEPLFSSEAVELVSDLSSGIPRLINKICIHSLNYAALKNQSVVTPELVAQAANNEVIDIILKGVNA